MSAPASTEDASPLTEASKRLTHRLFVICENRLQLLMVEAQEERERIMCAIWMAMIVAGFSLLAGFAITLLVALLFWNCHPVIALLVLAVIYIIIAVSAYSKLAQLQKDWQTLPSTIDQLKKDRECLEKYLG